MNMGEIPDLVMTNIANWTIAIEIVDWPMKIAWWFPMVMLVYQIGVSTPITSDTDLQSLRHLPAATLAGGQNGGPSKQGSTGGTARHRDITLW